MDSESCTAMNAHLALIRRVHERELKKILDACERTPPSCPHCGKPVEPIMHEGKPDLRLVASHN